MKRSLCFSAIALISVSLFLTGCAGMNAAGFDVGSITKMMDQGQRLLGAVEGLNPEQEYYLGRGVAVNIVDKYGPYGKANDSLTKYVNQVGQNLVAFSDMPHTYNGYYFMVLNSDELNAFATPGGFVFVTKGLIKEMPDEDALAAVLAHEIGHVVFEHGVGAVETSIITDIAASTGLAVAESQAEGVSSMILSQTKSFGIAIDDIAEKLLVNGYSRSQEYDADEYAVILLGRTGYNPNGLRTMLQKLEELEKEGGVTSGLMATHPPAEDRLEEIEDMDILKTASMEASPAQLVRAKRFQLKVKSLG